MPLPNLAVFTEDDSLFKKIIDNVIGFLGQDVRQLGTGGNGLVGQIASGIAQFFQSVIQTILGGIGTGISSLISWIRVGTYYIFNFNWNASDAQLNQQIQNAEIGLQALLGSALGSAIGYTTCGGITGAAIAVWSPQLALLVLKEVGREALEEATGYVAAIIQSTLYLEAQKWFINSFKNNRQLYNFAANFAGTVIGTSLQFLTGSRLNWENYRKQREKTNGLVSFADFFEESLETLPPPQQAFWENFFEEAVEACFEALYIAAASVDDFLAKSKIQKEVVLGRNRKVEITLNRNIPKEKIVLTGREEILIPKIADTLTNYQIWGNRDIGTVFALPPTETIRNRPNARLITITFRSVQSPPWRYTPEGVEYVEFSVEIPDARRNITWEQVKLAAGGANGYLYGRYTARATTENYRDITCPGGTEEQARLAATRFASLGEHPILYINVVEEINTGVRLANPRLQKEAIQVYPSSFTITAHNRLLNPALGRPSTKGNLRRDRVIIDLWPDTEPEGTAELINQLFSNPDL